MANTYMYLFFTQYIRFQTWFTNIFMDTDIYRYLLSWTAIIFACLLVCLFLWSNALTNAFQNYWSDLNFFSVGLLSYRGMLWSKAQKQWKMLNTKTVKKYASLEVLLRAQCKRLKFRKNNVEKICLKVLKIVWDSICLSFKVDSL